MKLMWRRDGNLMDTKSLSRKAIRWGCIAFALVLVAGFGVMLIMYIHWLRVDASNYPQLNGLFDYKASLWGDAICLPLIVGAGTAYIMFYKHRVHNKLKLWLPLALGILGGIMGTLMQAQWIISDTTNPNWSIPVVHQFNYAGWYHAVFFVAVFFAVSYIAGYMILIDISLAPRNSGDLMKESSHRLFYSLCQFIIWFAGLLFLHFHYLDDLSNQYSGWIIIGFISILGLIIIIGKKLIINRKLIIEYYLPVLFAIAISAELALISIQGNYFCEPMFLLAGLLCSALYIYNSEYKLKMLGIFVTFALLEYSCQIQMSRYLAIGNNTFGLLVFIACIIIPVIISIIDRIIIEKERINDKHLYPLLVALLINCVPLLLSHSDSPFIQSLIEGISISLRSGIASIVILTLLHKYVKQTFPRIQDIEYDSDADAKKLDSMKLSQYTIYGFAYLAAIILLWNALDLKNTLTLHCEWIYIIITVLVIALCCLGIKKAKNNRISTIYLFLAYIAILIFLFASPVSFSIIIDGIWHWTNALMTIYTACNMAIIMALSMLYNVDLLRWRDISKDGIVAAVSVGVFSSLCYGLAAYHFFLFRTIMHAIQLVIVTLVSFCLLPYVFAWKFNPDGNVGLLQNQKARQGILQDGFLFGIVANANTIITMAILENLAKPSFNEKAIGIMIFLSYSVGLFPLCNYCLKNNNKHEEEKGKELERVREVKEKNDEWPEWEEQYKNLRTWLHSQNTLAIFLSMPYSLMFYIKEQIKTRMEKVEKRQKEEGTYQDKAVE